MHHVTRFDPGALAVPQSYESIGAGFRRQSHVDRSVGAVHTGFGTCELDAGGSLAPHVHSYEELIFVVEGHPRLTIDGASHELGPNDAAFIGVGATHAWSAPSSGACRWIELQTPPARKPGEAPDTFPVGASVDAADPVPIDPRDPRLRSIYRWDRAQMDVDQVKQPTSVDAPSTSASMSSALLAYAGIGIKMLIDERHGAFMGQLFMVNYEIDVVLHPHDHPLEEAFYMLEGEVVYIADGSEYTLGVGDVAFAGVGCVHAFENRSGAGCRWLETRAPHPTRHHSYRFDRDWDYLTERLAGN